MLVKQRKSLIPWDVDTQIDFINEDGALPVGNAKEIRPIIKQMTNFFTKNGITIWGSMDWHDKQEESLPLHCMINTPGAKKIAESLANESLAGNVQFIDILSKTADLNEIATRYIQLGKENDVDQIIIRKQTYNVFNEPIMSYLMPYFLDKTIVIYGVATDICVQAAALGFLKEHCKVIVIQDAIKGINATNEANAIQAMKDNGAIFMTWAKFIDMYGNTEDRYREIF
jgi:nicotinamidase/pyrazinamidase